MKRRNRVMSLVLMILILMQSFTSVIAAPQTMTDKEIVESAKWATVNKLKSLQSSLNNKATGQYGLLYNFNYLVQYLGYLEFMLDVDALQFTDAEVELYLQDAVANIQNFNKRFSGEGLDIGTGVDGEQVTEGEAEIEAVALQLTEPASASRKDVKTAIKTIIEEEVPNYGELYLQHAKSSVAELGNDEDEDVNSDAYSPVRREISILNKILVFTSGHISHLKSILPKANKEDVGGMSNYNAFKQRVVGTDLEKILNDARDITGDLKDIIGNVEYKDANTYIEQLANVQLKTGADKSVYGPELWIPLNKGGEGFELSEMYLAILASSSVYRPLESKVGEEAMMQTLISLVGQDNESKVRRLYSETKDFRKPLFVVDKKKMFSKDDNEYEGGGRTKYSGSARKVTLKELMELSETNKSYAFITVKGDLKENPADGNSYTYFLEGGSQKYEGGTDTPGTPADGETADPNADTQPGSGEIIIEGEDGGEGDDEVTPGEGATPPEGGGPESETPQNNGSQMDGTPVARKTLPEKKGFNLAGLFDFMKPIDVMADPETETPPETETTLPEAEDGDATKPPVQEEDGNNKDTEGVKGTELAGQVMVPDGTTISTVHWTDVVFEIGKDSSSGTLNRLLLGNVMKSVRNKKELKKWENSFLYINAYGDITLADNTVVIPGSANASLYSDIYNPYTVAFYNYYPKIKPYSKKIEFYEHEDAVKGKYVVREYSEFEGTKSKAKLPKGVLTNPIKMFKVQGESNLKIFGAFRGSKLVCKFYNEGQELMPTFLKAEKKQSGVQEGAVDKLDGKGAYLIPQPVAFNNIPILPYDSTIDKGYTAAQLIGKNMLWSYINTDAGNANVGNGVLRENFIFENLVLEGIGGTPYAETYQKITSASQVLEKPYNLFVSLVMDTTTSILEKSRVDGILGMKNRYEIPFFGKIYRAFSEYAYYAVAVLFILFIANYLRQQYNATAVVVYTLFAGALTYLFLAVVPVYIPIVYNSVVNDLGNRTGYEIVLTGSEVYEKAYGQATEKDKNGRYLNRLGSINLYKLGDKDMEQVAKNLAIPVRDLKGGDVVEVDTQNSIYIEGDFIKVNIDTLFANNPIRGQYTPTDDGMMYQLKAYKETSSMMDYYMPYYLLEENFIDELNGFLRSYNIPRMTVKYLDGLNKDSFLVYNYTNSLPFLSPEDLYSDKTMQPDQEAKLVSNLGDMNDFLNIRKILEEPSKAVTETLWWRVMTLKGYFDNTPEAEELREDLIYYVNYHTKKFIIELGPEAGMASDENLIKLISLKATTLFNQRISHLRSWVHPTQLNFAEFQLEDVLRVTLSDTNRKFYENNLDIVNYTQDTKGLAGSIGLLIVTALMWGLAIILPSAIHALYLSLLVLILYKYLTDKDVKSTVQGYMKSNLMFFILFTLFTVTAANVSSLLILTLVMIINAVFLSMIILNILYNFQNLGNDSFRAVISSLRGKLQRASFKGAKVDMSGTRNQRTEQEIIEDMMLDDPQFYNHVMSERRRNARQRERRKSSSRSGFNERPTVDEDFLDEFGDDW